MSSTTTTAPATSIMEQPGPENDMEVSVRVMRSCVFLSIRRRGGPLVAHVDISRAGWAWLASSPPPVDDPAEPEVCEACGDPDEPIAARTGDDLPLCASCADRAN